MKKTLLLRLFSQGKFKFVYCGKRIGLRYWELVKTEGYNEFNKFCFYVWEDEIFD